MPALPESGTVNLAQGVQFEQFPSHTWYIDKKTGRIRGTAGRAPRL